MPLVLDVTPAGDWYLLGAVETYQGREDYGLFKRERYVAFQLKGDAWKRIPFKGFPEKFEPNLFTSRGDFFFGEDRRPIGFLVPLETKERLDSSKLIDPAYRRIDRSRGE